jgi:hypothetical protein
MLLIIITISSLLYQHNKHGKYVTVSFFFVRIYEGQYISIGFEKMIVFIANNENIDLDEIILPLD